MKYQVKVNGKVVNAYDEDQFYMVDEDGNDYNHSKYIEG